MSLITAGGPLLDDYIAGMPLGRVGHGRGHRRGRPVPGRARVVVDHRRQPAHRRRPPPPRGRGLLVAVRLDQGWTWGPCPARRAGSSTATCATWTSGCRAGCSACRGGLDCARRLPARAQRHRRGRGHRRPLRARRPAAPADGPPRRRGRVGGAGAGPGAPARSGHGERRVRGGRGRGPPGDDDRAGGVARRPRVPRRAGFDVNPVVWKVLADRGVAVRGPEPADLGLDPEPGGCGPGTWPTSTATGRAGRPACWRPPARRRRAGSRWAVSWGTLGAPAALHDRHRRGRQQGGRPATRPRHLRRPLAAPDRGGRRLPPRPPVAGAPAGSASTGTGTFVQEVVRQARASQPAGRGSTRPPVGRLLRSPVDEGPAGRPGWAGGSPHLPVARLPGAPGRSDLEDLVRHVAGRRLALMRDRYDVVIVGGGHNAWWPRPTSARPGGRCASWSGLGTWVGRR